MKILKLLNKTSLSIFLIGDGKLILSIKIIATISTNNANIILTNIPKIPFEFPILVFFSNSIYC